MRWPVPLFGLVAILVVPACRERSTSSVAVQVAVGERHACAAFADGAARCWGSREDGQRGDGVALDARPEDWLSSRELRLNPKTGAVPNQVLNLTEAVELAAGQSHTCARRKDGTVWCWGPAGRLGSESAEDPSRVFPYPVRVSGITDAVQLAAGARFTCARRSDRTVWCWGDLRDSPASMRGDGFAPRPLPGVHDAADLRIGEEHACVLLARGSVLCWGSSSKGRLGDGTGRDTSVVSQPLVLSYRDAAELALAETHLCGASSAGKVTCRGSSSFGQTSAPQGVALVAVAAARQNTCGLSAEGAFWCWGGSSLFRDLTPGVARASDEEAVRIATVSGAKQVVVGDHHACLRLESGAVHCWGRSWRDTADEERDQARGPFVVEGLRPAIDIAADGARTCAVVEGGSVQCWTRVKRLAAVPGVTDATQIALGPRHACAARIDGTVACWGQGDRGQLGRGRSERGEEQPAAMVPGLGAVERLAAGYQSTCALSKGGVVRCWGNNEKGELGQGFFSSGGAKSAIGEPLTVLLPSPAVNLWAGGRVFCAKLSDGAIACWGSNAQRLILDEQVDSKRKPPTPVGGVNDGTQIALADDHACVRTKTGKVLCWGSNEYGQMGDGTWGAGNERSTPVEIRAFAGAMEVLVSSKATCARMQGGRVACVGGGGGTLWDLPGLESAKQVALSPTTESTYSYADDQPERPSGCAVMTNGALACWGASVPTASEERPKTGPPVQVRW